MAAPSVYFVAVEPSADLLAAETVDALRKVTPDIRFGGVGGIAMAARGLQSDLDLSPLAIVGFIEGLRAYKTAIALADKTVAEIIEFAPDVVVLVDSWGFTLRVAQRLKAQAPNIEIIKLVGPQVWATRPGRAKTLAATVDQLICIHAMEAPYYEPYGLTVTVMGNPALSRSVAGDKDRLRATFKLDPEANTLLILPGSRMSEIKLVAPVFVNAAWILKAERPDLEIIVAPAPAVREAFLDEFPNLDAWAHIADADMAMADIMAGADYALACSGTVTSELAVQGTPFLVGYKTGALTWLLGKHVLYQPEHITLLNIAADDTEIAPEFLQAELRPELVAREALKMLDDPMRRADQVRAQNNALEKMRVGDMPAAQVAAGQIWKSLT